VIDLATESPIPLAAAAKLVPPARSGKRTHLSTILRWILTGAKAPDGQRVRLEAIRLGGRWMTTREALQRFTERLTPRLDGGAAPSAPRTESRRRRASERAAEELKRLGM
jgi:hypothetical protein